MKKSYRNLMTDWIKKLRIIPEQTSLLQISAEPGHFLLDAKADFKQVAGTVYSPEYAEFFQEESGVSVFSFDFNCDDLDQKLKNQKFDVVYVHSCLNYCRELRKLIRGLHKSINDEGYCVINFVCSSRTALVRFSFFDYPYQRFWSPDGVLACFLEAGFSLIHRHEEGTAWDFIKVYRIKNPFILPIYYFYKRKSKIEQFADRNYCFIFQKKTV